MLYLFRIAFVQILLSYPFFSAFGQEVSFERAKSFYPLAPQLKGDSIEWGYFIVPENWDSPALSKKIRIAVVVLKNTKRNRDTDPLIFIQGGPGGGGIGSIWGWLKHPLREEHDIVLFDCRGTGWSEPRLCPDLGKRFLEILAKNQTAAEDERQKTAEALTCKLDLLNRGVDINSYNSDYVAKDLHALLKQLGYNQWNISAASYGTYVAQVYANTFAQDVKSMILDSPISDITTYYTNNTSNCMGSLAKVFERCKNNAECNREYPILEQVYYQTIEQLKEDPITVSVENTVVPAGEFTYNAEDFKIAIQQALYRKQLVEVLPLLIYQFHHRNKDALSNLTAAFAGILGMDYGVYYCMSCNEALPNNDPLQYEQDARQYKQLQGGLSFYRADFAVCQEWNKDRADSVLLHHDLSRLAASSIPVLVLSGEFDPITPMSNGHTLAEQLHATWLTASSQGHAPGFTKSGNEIVDMFVSNPAKPPVNAFTKDDQLNFVGNIKVNSGVSRMGKSLNQREPLFLTPAVIALLLSLASIFIYGVKLIRARYVLREDQIIRAFIVLTSVAGILVTVGFIIALQQLASQNFYILAFGLPTSFQYLFTFLFVFSALLALTLFYFIVNIKTINNRSVTFSVIFSNILIAVYLFYWGIL